jgi:O-antigen ligase
MFNYFNSFALHFIAISVGLGVFFVSLSKIILIIDFLVFLFIVKKNIRFKKTIEQAPSSLIVLFVACLWMALSYLWTDALDLDAGKAINRHLRLLILVFIYYLIQTRDQAISILKYLLVVQFVTILLSWLMFMDIYFPFEQRNQQLHLAAPFTSTLEQPVMTSIALAVVFFLWDDWIKFTTKSVLIFAIVLSIANIVVVMSGRTGYITLFALIILIACYKKYKKKITIFMVLLSSIPVLFFSSPRFHDRTLEIYTGIQNYRSGHVDSSEGHRLEYWEKSFKSMSERPFFGSGVGSWRNEYYRLNGVQINPPSNPHNQFLLWGVEAGFVGLFLITLFFISLIEDARKKLEKPEAGALISVTVLAVLVGVFNCPLYGAGMGEFFMVLFGSLLAMGKFSEANKKELIRQIH